MNKRELAKAIYEISHITGKFQLRSGVMSDEYFDKYRFESQPFLLKRIAHSMVPLIPTGTEVLAGLEMGGIPIVTMLSQASGIPAAFVRKKAKQYGTCRFAEGAEIEDKRVCVVEDVVTSGGQIILSATDLRSASAYVDTVLCVVDREAGAKEKLGLEGLELRPLFTKTELENSMERRTNSST
jgi:orotate phosphoribosyltransferase